MARILLKLCCLTALFFMLSSGFFCLDGQSLTNHTQVKKKAAYPVMTFEKPFIDLGAVKKGEKRSFSFPFSNTGTAPLTIDIVSACECTTTEYPTKDIQPGEKAAIEVVFDSTEKEEEETIDIDIFLTQTDPNTGGPIVERVQYHFELLK